MRESTVTMYASRADAKERDPIVIPGEHGRADIANGRMSKWERFHKGENLVWVDCPDGRTVALTHRQISTLTSIRRLAGTGVRITMRGLAAHVGQSPSSVSRTAVKLASFGFIAYQSNRGRYGGTVWVLRSAGDTLGWFQEAAKAKVRRWAKAAQERFSRLISNVAPYPYDEMSRLRASTSTSTYIERNIRTGWTPQELREAGII